MFLKFVSVCMFVCVWSLSMFLCVYLLNVGYRMQLVCLLCNLFITFT